VARLDSGLDETERKLAARDTSRWAEFADLVAEDCHPQQRDFVLDPARHIGALCGRGGGKTVGGRARFLRRMLTTPNANCFYLAKFRDHAERLMWKPLKASFKKLGFVTGVDVIYNETKLRCTLPKTGATLQLWGADKPGYIEALRGESYHEVGIDEAAIHSDKVLSSLIYAIIGPRLLGAIWLIGTPGPLPKGLFYEVTRRGSTRGRLWTERDAHPGWKGWSVHKWSLKSAIESTVDRPIEELIKLYEIQQEEIASQGLSNDNPLKRREYDGEWAADDTSNAYRYRIHIEGDDAKARGLPDGTIWNQWDPPREGPLQMAVLPAEFSDWAHVIALDLGFSDPTAINVFAFSPSDTTRTIYHRWGFEAKGMYAQTVAFKLIGEDLNHENPGGVIGAVGGWPNGMVADSAHQMGAAQLAELANVYGVRIEPAVKGFRYKVGAIEIVNGDLVDGRIKVLKGSELEAQMLDLQWAESPRTGEPMERKDQPNHSSDCAIYARSLISSLISAGMVAATDTDPRRDPKSPLYQPPMPDEVMGGEYDHLFQDDLQALMG
jgi:hypothetical protein